MFKGIYEWLNTHTNLIHNKKLVCPICGSSDLFESTKTCTLRKQFGIETMIEETVVHCNECKSSGDFFNQNDDLINEALSEFKKDCVKKIIDFFVNHTKCSITNIERILGIPFGTLDRWNNGTELISDEGFALLQFLKLFPWLLIVADENYDEDKAKEILKIAANRF